MRTKCKYIDKYMEAVRSGGKKASDELIMAMDYIDKKLTNPDIFIDSEKIEKAIELIEKYFRFKLFDWEIFIIGLVHCYYLSTDQVVFNEFYIMMGRGNGKNGFISCLAWYLTTHYHGIQGYNVDIIANSQEQAKTSFEEIYNMLDATWEKSKRFYYKSLEIIRNLRTKSYIKFNTSNAKTKDGKRSACLIFDERHGYENSAQIGVFSSGFGKRKHSRIFSITTDGYIREGVLDDDLLLCMDVLTGAVTDLGLCPLLYRMSSDEECEDPDAWEKANPSIQYLPELRKAIENDFIKKKYDKQTELDFYTKRMNRPRTHKEMAVTEWENIAATNRPLPDMTGWECTVGIDYASLRDWAAVNFHFRRGEERYDIGKYWVCTQNPDIDRIKAPWANWAECVAVDDVEIAPELLTEYIKTMGRKYTIKKIAMDNYRFSLLRDALESIGFELSGRKNIHLVRPSDIYKIQPLIESCFNRQLFAWGDNPGLRWATNNTKIISAGRKGGTDTGNYYYAKIEAKSRKTDPFMALVAAMIVEEEIMEAAVGYVDLPVIMG